MSGELFITVYLDEDVHVLVARLLAQRNCVAVTARDADQLGKSDPEQLEYAAKRGMAIVTHNRGDFESLHRQYLASGQIHAGILIAIDNQPYRLARRILAAWDMYTADEMRNQLLYI